MNEQQQRIAIAKVRGWEKADHLGLGWWRNPNEKTVCFESELPNYPFDLNAMHEVEKVLGLKYDQWTRELRTICARDRRCVESATAAQRAEAFLKTLGLWEETL